MHDHLSQERLRTQFTACVPLEPSNRPDPLHEYRALAREFQEGAPATEAQQLDKQIAWTMANFGGYTPAAIAKAMRVASVYLARVGSDDHTYVERTVAAAMQEDVWGDMPLGWGA
jgi:hypothetical protein